MFSINYLKAFYVKKCLDRVTESHLVLLDVCKFLIGIPFKLHIITLPQTVNRHHKQRAQKRVAI